MHIEKKALCRAQKVCKTVVPSRAIRPVLGSVLIRDGYAFATDLEHTVKVALAPGAQTEPAFLVPWAAFKGLRGDVGITPVLTDPEKPKVKIGGVLLESFKIDDYPTINDAVPSHLQTVNLEHLLLHLRRCDAVRAEGETARALLTGTAVCEDGAIMATDGFGVYWSDPEPCYEGRALAAAAGGQGVLPGPTCAILSAFGWDHASAGAETKTVEQDSYAGGKRTTIKANQTRWYFGSDGEAAWLRGLEGTYFAVRDLVPKEFPHTITFNRLELLAACQQAAKVASEAPHAVTLEIAGPTVRVYAKHEGDEYDSDLRNVDTAGQPVTIGFNAKQLEAALKPIADGQAEVTLELSGEKTLARVKVSGGTYCQMPLQLADFEVPERKAGSCAAVPEPAVALSQVHAPDRAPEPDPAPVPVDEADEPQPVSESEAPPEYEPEFEPVEVEPTADPDTAPAAQAPAPASAPTEAQDEQPTVAIDAPCPAPVVAVAEETPDASSGADVIGNDVAVLIRDAQCAVAEAQALVARLLAS